MKHHRMHSNRIRKTTCGNVATHPFSSSTEQRNYRNDIMSSTNYNDETKQAISAKDNNLTANDNNNNYQPLTERYCTAIALVESSPDRCLSLLQRIQEDVETLSLFSNNETVEDVSTKSIQFLALEHFMATALVNLPAGSGAMAKRKSNILQSLTLWGKFLERLETLEILTKEETNEYHDLLEDQQQYSNTSGDGVEKTMNKLPPVPNRDEKIARFKAKQHLQKEIERIKALRDRRSRCGVAAEDEMDGHDHDSLERSLALAEVSICKFDALENWSQSMRELPMIERMVKLESERQHMDRHAGKGTMGGIHQCLRPSGTGLQVTHITKDSSTGQLHFKRDEIRSKVFRPGWSQPTMTLEELGEQEFKQAMEREERHKRTEANRKYEPRRYEELVRDGMEDNSVLVDASTKLDRDWDDWKDSNPRGSGNKMANRGDKNF
jgi:immunoglobulin-binding protein 1